MLFHSFLIKIKTVMTFHPGHSVKCQLGEVMMDRLYSITNVLMLLMIVMIVVIVMIVMI